MSDRSIIGLKRGSVRLSSNHKEWGQLFNLEKKSLLKIVGSGADIEHIGSTSIAGVLAKPIIDMILRLPSNVHPDDISEALEESGYEDRGEQGVSERHFFVKGPDDNRTHYLHVVEKDSDLWTTALFFRDYLRQNKHVREEYNSLKERLARQFPNDRKEYTKRKAGFINEIIGRAQTS